MWRIVFLNDQPEWAHDLARWHAREWQHLYDKTWNTEVVLADFRAQHTNGSLPTTLLALDGADLLGSVSLVFNDLPGRTDPNPWLASLFVLPEQRRRGVGRFLVNQARALFERNGYPEFYLFTEARESFFTALGFTRLEETTAQGHPVVIMRSRPTGNSLHEPANGNDSTPLERCGTAACTAPLPRCDFPPYARFIGSMHPHIRCRGRAFP